LRKEKNHEKVKNNINDYYASRFIVVPEGKTGISGIY
jgi:hypothetical protein